MSGKISDEGSGRDRPIRQPAKSAGMTEARALNLLALRAYMDGCLAEPTAGPLDAILISGGRSNLTYRVSDGQRRWVLRRPPLGHVLPSAHDMGREFRVMAGLAKTAVPVPTTVALCSDANVIGTPFYLMDEVDGTVYRDQVQLGALSEADRGRLATALVDTLAELHAVNPEAAGLADLGRPDGYLARQVARWSRQYEAIKVRELPDVIRLAERLEATLPSSPAASIVHGDYRIDNVMFAPGVADRVVAVLDWEMATLGDPLADLGILVSFWDEPGRPHNPISAGLTAMRGFPSAAEVVARYAERRKLGVDDLDWYIVFGFFKLTVILEQIYARHLRGETLGDGFETIGDMVLQVLDRGLDVAARSRTAGLRV